MSDFVVAHGPQGADPCGPRTPKNHCKIKASNHIRIFGQALSKRAEDDIKRIYRYGIETFGQKQADSYFDALFDKFDSVAQSPTIYQAIDIIRPGYRRCVFGSHTIYYRSDGNGTVIACILGREDPVLTDVYE